MNTEIIIQDDLNDIAAIAYAIAEEIGSKPNSPAVRAGVEAYAKARTEDLRRILSDYQNVRAYQPIQDMLTARIRAITDRYGLTQ